MTHTDPTAAALLRGVLLHPADDTARLVYADWLDEHAGTVPCPECKGRGEKMYSLTGRPAECITCRGAGTASDGFAERAEFIRVQCELDPLLVLRRAHSGTCPTCQTREGEYHRYECRLRDLCARERELLTDARRREWFGIPCPVCRGNGPHVVGGCILCTGTGTGFAPVEFRRGFVDRVRCRMADVLREQYEGHASGLRIVPGEVLHPREWVLTPWARGVLDAHPVTRWEIADREPWASHASAYWGWWTENPPQPPDQSTLPHVVIAALADDSRRCDAGISLRYRMDDGTQQGACALFATEAEARDALALAVGRMARRLAGLEATP